jgi:hypothetical protein
VAEFITFDDAKKRLGKTDQELQEMMDKGELRGFRDAGTWKFRKEDIDAKAAAGGEKKESGDTLMSIDADILFAEEEEVPADSAAETWIAADTEGVFPAQPAAQGVEQAMAAPEAEPAPLALSPETDESSLGAVLSDEELGGGEAGGEEPVIAVDAESGVASVSASTSGTMAPSRTRVVTLVEPPAHHAQFTFMLALGAIALALAVYAFMALLSQAPPAWLSQLAGENVPLIIMVAAAVIVGIAALVGFVLDKNRAAREAAGGV